MNFDMVEVELEGLDWVDLGDAAVETRQRNPVPLFTDSTYGMGDWCC